MTLKKKSNQNIQNAVLLLKVLYGVSVFAYTDNKAYPQALHKILCKSKSDQAKGGLRSKHDLGFPFNCMVPVSRDGMRAAGVNTVSAHGKNESE